MHNKKPPTFAFVGWNAFQMLRFRELARALPGSVLIVEKRPGRICEIPDELVTSLNPPLLVWDADRMHELDGLFDVFVCQTVFSEIERFERSKIAMLQYGLAKEPHNHGSWRAFADLCLVYGPYTAQKIAHLCPTAEVGNPHFDTWHSPEFHDATRRRFTHIIDPSKKTILYVPTWGPLSTQDDFVAHVEALTDEYNVLIKLHHNTALLERDRTSNAVNNRVQYFGADMDLLELLAVADLTISDYSGAIFDALYCEKPVILLQTRSTERFGSKLDRHSLEYAQRHRIGPVIESPWDLRSTIRRTLEGNNPFHADNVQLVTELFVEGACSTQRSREQLLMLATGQSIPPTAEHFERRDKLKKGRKKPASGLERTVIERLLAHDLSHLVLPYIEVRNLIRPNLSLYRLAIRTARQRQDVERTLRLVAAAQRDYPASHIRMDAKLARSRAPGQAALHSKQSPEMALLSDLTTARRADSKAHSSATTLRRKRKHSAAYRVLAKYQILRPGSQRTLKLLSRLLLDDGQPLTAHAFMVLAEDPKSHLQKAQRLYLESEQGWYKEGEQTLGELLSAPPLEVSKHLPTINRSAPYYPAARKDLAELRRHLRSHQRRIPFVATRKAFSRSLTNRWLSEMKTLSGAPLSTVRPQELNHVRMLIESLGPLAYLVELAWANEHEERLHWIAGEESGQVHPSELPAGYDTVEFFIPSVFFARRTDEKATYKTVRQAFRTVGELLLDAPNTAIIPRLQLNWRYARPRSQARVVSYHTQTSEERARRTVHLQETPLAGFVSIDSRGYAGFSSLASDFSQIEKSTADVPAHVLEETRARLYEQFVLGNTSKYPQSRTAFESEGPYVFVALQVASDSVAQLTEMNGPQLLRAVTDAYAGTGIQVIAKRHPYCKSPSLDRTLRELELRGRLRVSNHSVHALISSSVAVYTCNSGVGLEALMHLKPVVVTGSCDYLYAATYAPTPEAIHELARSGVPFNRERVLRLLHYYVNNYAVQPEDREAMKRALLASPFAALA